MMSQSMSGSFKGGAHTQFKENLKADLHAKVSQTVRLRAGPSWDERMEKAVKGFQAKAAASEKEMKQNLAEAIEKGRSRKTSAPFRDAALAPNQGAMLKARQKKMHDLEMEYRDQIERLKDKMEKREPLFRLSEVNAAFAMQAARMKERKRQMMQDEHERWEHLRSMEEKAASRPLLITDPTYKPPKKVPQMSQSSPNLGSGGGGAESAAASPQAVHARPQAFGGREEYEKDIKIRDAVNSRWFQQTPWAEEVRQIRERADNRKKLHEIEYPNKGDRHALTRNRLMHQLPAQVPAVY